jgi:hypothetical protein
MKTQNYKNHIRYYTMHHLIFYPVIILLFVLSFSLAFKYSDFSLEWLAISALFLVIGWLSFMVRQHYALINQNRIIRLEMRFRYYVLTHLRLESIENKLSFSQLAALRFASDEELVPLINRTIDEKLSADDIKKSIQVWVPDYMRV